MLEILSGYLVYSGLELTISLVARLDQEILIRKWDRDFETENFDVDAMFEIYESTKTRINKDEVVPYNIHPVQKYPDVARCAAMQAGPVWFMPSAMSGQGEMNFQCNIPQGKDIMFDLSGTECENGGVEVHSHHGKNPNMCPIRRKK
jgi:hypothetical protein